jgi:hypothetical protein
MNCTIMVLAHVWLIYPLGHVYVEPELEEPTEQTQAKDPANRALDQGKPWCINQCPLSFISESIFMLIFGCALSYRSCMTI